MFDGVAQVESRGCLHFVLDMARLLGLSETNQANQAEAGLLRLLTPVSSQLISLPCTPSCTPLKCDHRVHVVFQIAAMTLLSGYF